MRTRILKGPKKGYLWFIYGEDGEVVVKGRESTYFRCLQRVEEHLCLI